MGTGRRQMSVPQKPASSRRKPDRPSDLGESDAGRTRRAGSHPSRSRQAAGTSLVEQIPHRKFELVLKTDLRQISKVERFLHKINRLLGLDEIQFNKLMIATTEAVSNGMIHGNKRDPKKKVFLTFDTGPKSVVVRVRDEGKGFDPAHIRNPLRKSNLLRENGRGIFLMRTLMDKVRFTITPDGSEVTMKLRMDN